MRKHRSIKFMLVVTMLLALLCGFIGWVACQVEEPRDEKAAMQSVKWEAKYRGNKYLSEAER